MTTANTTALSISTEDTAQKNLPIAQKPLVERIPGIDYSISLARKQQPIGKMLASGHSVDIFLDDLGKVVYQVIGDFGIKNLPDEVSEKRITHYIVSYFRDLTLEDIRLAFELAIAGELDVKAEHYQSFDLHFICKILNAYRIRLRKANQNLVQKGQHKTKELDISEDMKKQYRKEFNQTLCEQYEKFCKTGTIGVMAYSFVFDLFEREQILVLNQKKIDGYKMKAIEAFRIELSTPSREGAMWDNRRILKNFEAAINGSEKNRIESLIKKIALIDFFKACKKNKVDFEKLITK